MNTGSNPHRETWDLIPWLINGTATAAQRDGVAQHLRECADCRDEFALQQQFHAGMLADADAAHDPQPALRQLFARLDDESALPDGAIAPRAARSRVTPWLAAAVIVQAIGLALLGGMLLGRPAGGVVDYRTLSSTVPADADAALIRLAVASDTTLGELRRVLGEARLRIVESTADNGAFGLAPVDASLSTNPEFVAVAVARLRTQPGVILAEPVVRAAP